MSMTNTAENMVLTWLLTTTAPSPVRPTAWYIGLFTAAPSDTGGGTEVSTGSYARAAVTFTVSGTSPTQGTNSAQIDHATSTGAWGTITHAAIFDALTVGNMLWWGSLTASKTMASGDVFRWPASSIVLTLD
jgi:hypothetical protein